ncbi:hypothetical protein N9X28_02135 [Candidatus Poseidoniales archaeon]|nr:hypothetical protein [Candidatus Poseidoniales archaeon]MDB2542014.1 hypothetical protein [Candidatus Poseidoniales archaeon]
MSIPLNDLVLGDYHVLRSIACNEAVYHHDLRAIDSEKEPEKAAEEMKRHDEYHSNDLDEDVLDMRKAESWKEMRIADVDELHSLDIDIPEDLEKMLQLKAQKMQPLKEWLEFKEDANPRSIEDNIFIRGIISKEEIGSMFWDYLSSETVPSEKKINQLWIRTRESKSTIESEIKSVRKSIYFKEGLDYFKIKSINIIIGK